MHFLQANYVWILLAISEGLALSPLKSNSLVQLLINGLKALAGSSEPKV